MTVTELIKQLKELEANGYEDAKVLVGYTCNPLDKVIVDQAFDGEWLVFLEE